MEKNLKAEDIFKHIQKITSKPDRFVSDDQLREFKNKKLDKLSKRERSKLLAMIIEL